MEPVNTQTLLFFYIHEITIYKKEVENIIEKLSKIVLANSDIAIVLLRDYIDYDESKSKFSFRVTLSSFEYTPGQSYLEHKIIEDSTDRDSRLEKEELGRYFKTVFTRYQAGRKVMVTFSHSNGFAINLSNDDNLYVDKGILKNGYTVVDNVDVDSVNDERKNNRYAKLDIKDGNKAAVNKLWIYELVEQLDKSVGKDEYIDMMAMVNCDMQLLDSLFQIRKKVKYLVASQTQFSYYGFHYTELITTLRKYPAIPNDLLAKEIVKQFVSKYSLLVQGGTDKITSNSLFANDLTYIYQLIELLNNVSNYLIKIVDRTAVKQAIQIIRAELIEDVSVYPGNVVRLQCVDFGGLLQAFADTFTEKLKARFLLYYKMYALIMESISVASFIGDDYLLQDKFEKRKYNLSGISLYFPDSKEDINGNDRVRNYINFGYKSKYKQVTRWDDFLVKYYT